MVIAIIIHYIPNTYGDKGVLSIFLWEYVVGHIVWDILRWWTSKSFKYGNVYYRKTHAEELHPPLHPHLGHQWTHKSCYNPAVNEINPCDNSDMWVLNHLPTGFTGFFRNGG